jgi:hypothetical protein
MSKYEAVHVTPEWMDSPEVELKSGVPFPAVVGAMVIPSGDEPIFFFMSFAAEAGGRPEVVEIRIYPRSHAGARALSNFSDLPLEAIANLAIERIAEAWTERRFLLNAARVEMERQGGAPRHGYPLPAVPGEVTEAAVRAGAAARHTQRTEVTHELLKQVAAVYRADGKAPTTAVMHAWNVSRRTANRWLAQAREAGLLAPFDPSQPHGAVTS